MRLAIGIVALLAGLVAGAALTMALQGPTAPVHEASPSAPAGTVTSTVPTTSTSLQPSTTVALPPSSEVLLIWVPGSLPDGFADAVAAIDGVEAVTSVRSDLAHLIESRDAFGAVVDRTEGGFVVPLETMAFDPATYGAFVPAEHRALFASPPPASVLLGETSAELRRLGPGAVLTLADGTRLTVTAVVPDELIGAAELAVPTGSVPVANERYLLARYQGEREALEATIRALLPEGTGARVRGPGETPVFRHGDAVLAQSVIKVRFGEFAYRPGDGLSFEIDPVWRGENIVTATVPLLGTITCHRAIVPLVDGAMQELVDRGLSHIVDASTFRGCFNPRYISGRRGISRHAWGVALDINWGANPTGLASAQDPRLVDTMDRWGFTSGHSWLIPDAGHFEWHH